MKKTSTGISQLNSTTLRSLKITRQNRVAILCHPASVTAEYEHLSSIVDRSSNLVAMFGPQHGIHGETQDNMIEWQDSVDPKGRPVYSLYGERRKPSPKSLENIDTVIIDLFDVGARYYTFIYTMFYMMEACANAGIRVIVLDRPNPLGGQLVEGPILDLNFKSFVGLHEIPVCHGLTIGELALLFSTKIDQKLDLRIVRLKNWKRSQLFPETKLPWTLPSPNMPNFEAAVVYPGMCLLEATTLSEGRGTTRPFELIGAPFIEWNEVEREYLKLAKGLKLEPIAFQRQGYIPTFHKFKGQICKGVIQVVKRPKSFQPFRHAVTLLWIFRKLYGKSWDWTKPPYEYEFIKLPIDILAGGEKVRHTIDQSLNLRDLFKSFERDEEAFRKSRKPFLLYR